MSFSSQTGSFSREVPLSAMSDEELIIPAREGCKEAIEILVNRHKYYVDTCSHMYFLKGADREDLVQEGLIGLYKAVLGFNSKEAASFKTFARLCIKRQILTAVKMSTRKKHQPLNDSLSLDKDEGEGAIDHISYTGDRGADPEQVMLEKESVNHAYSQIDNALSEFEAKVLAMYLDGMAYEGIAKQLGTNKKSVDNALSRIRRKVEKFYLEQKS